MATSVQQSCIEFSSERAENPACQPTRQSGSKKGGFECEFVEKPPNAVQAECPVCLQILCEPYQVTCCGYSFCKTCIEQIQTGNKQCPTCNEKCSAFPNKGLQRSLYEFRVYCTHKQQGCEWTGELGQLDKHLNFNPQPDKQLQGCQYSEIECQFCHDLIQCHIITTHQADLCPKRPFSCEYCHNYQSDYDDVIHNHWPVCGFHPVPCPNECGTFPQRQNLHTHITNECPLTVIDCDFHHVGCDVKLPRKDMPTHLKENLVTHTSLQAASHSKLLASHTEQINKLLLENQALKIENLRLQLKIADLERSTKAQHTIEYNKLQQEIVKLREELIALSTPPNKQLIPYTGLPLPGYVEITMKNFQKHKKDNDEWYSPPFYTHLQGYKMCLRVDANGSGDGEGTHVSVGITPMRGEFDDHLKWPFRGVITIQLLNQERDEEHHSDTITYNDKIPNLHANRVIGRERQEYSWGKSMFISHKELKPNYLKNDSLYFRISKIIPQNELQSLYSSHHP